VDRSGKLIIIRGVEWSGIRKGVVLVAIPSISSMQLSNLANSQWPCQELVWS